ncbi:hypothetical protein GCM10008171_33170 [Methylopila jiangsuensis]|uniref:Uncharacterized protein n=1 Tax=Methylopila jiangsuensis TaxID=586230 RepID=A0A9W6JKW8_9HYPH|nr:hypothetical protein [Methylopila jiangsuensis]MDR6284549.1 hypothetical protein [Methylopila jiangsuensis]GLK78063.1 hypothetical protein GCM10008171_33170 [Methylopila jiangsuensis]
MDILSEIWAGLRPHVVETAVVIGAAAMAFAAAKALEALKTIKDRELALSLYRTIENGLKAIIARRALAGADLGPATTGAIVREVIDFAKDNNPAAVTKLGQSDDALHEKVLARLPEAKAAVVEAAAKLADAK